MSDSELFHKVMAMIRSDKYETTNELVHDIIETVDAARAQSGQGAEPVGYLHNRPERIPCFFESYDEAMLNGCEVVPVYIRPQPAQQGVPEFPDIGCNGECGFERAGVGYQCRDGEACGRYVHPGDEGFVEIKAYYDAAATPQPEGDGWVKCSERLPTEADADMNGKIWVFSEESDRKDKVFLLKVEPVRLHYPAHSVVPITHWTPTNLKRPQPPQEGEGDE